jgi:hypothetical protein
MSVMVCRVTSAAANILLATIKILLMQNSVNLVWETGTSAFHSPERKCNTLAITF